MTDRAQQTVRQLRASVREWVEDVDEMTMLIGHDRWLDIPVQEFQRIGESADPAAVVMMVAMWDVLALTRLEIAALPECDNETRMT